MANATWQGQIVAQSDDIVTVEGNLYFPRSALRNEFFADSQHTTQCGWKGQAHYLHLEVNGQRNENAAWYYPEPKEAAASIRGRVAFWKGVEVKP